MEEERIKHEKREEVENKISEFEKYVNESGLLDAFKQICSEILAKNIKNEEVFQYSVKRLREIGKAGSVMNEQTSMAQE